MANMFDAEMRSKVSEADWLKFYAMHLIAIETEKCTYCEHYSCKCSMGSGEPNYGF
jgi:hypothetical protein